jgi:transposase
LVYNLRGDQLIAIFFLQVVPDGYDTQIARYKKLIRSIVGIGLVADRLRFKRTRLIGFFVSCIFAVYEKDD